MKRDYSDPQYKKWRKEVYNRDKFTCQWPGCGSTIKINAHHICRWVDYPGLRYHTNNGITLCKAHHKMITGSEDSYIPFFSKLILNKDIKS